MNKIKQMLYEYLDEDSIKLISIGQKIEDSHWMIKKGYQKDREKLGETASLVDALSSSYGEITPKGKKFIDKSNREFKDLYEKTRKVLTIENESKTKAAIQRFVKNNRYAYSLDGLTEDERYAFMYFARNPMDSGHK